MDLLPTIERSVEIEAPPRAVWERIVDGTIAEEWLGIEIEPRVGGSVSIPGRDMIGAIEEIVDGSSITWSWRELSGEPSQVTIMVVEAGDGSLVTVTERLLRYEIVEVDPTWTVGPGLHRFPTLMAA
jgi:uncharacterized protein YndB with AHSA1/START domain